MYGHDNFMYQNMNYYTGSWYPFFFMALFALAVGLCSFRYGRAPDRLGQIAFYTTPVAIVITAVFALLPQPFGSLLYALAPVCMAPAITRRVYGVIRTAEPGRRLTSYVSAIAVCITAFTVWTLFAIPKELAYLIPALLALPAWLGVRRNLPLPEDAPAAKEFRLSHQLLLALAAIVVLLFWLDLTHAVIHTNIVATGSATASLLYTLLGWIIPPAGYLIYAVISDQGHERAGFICGMSLFLVAMLFALLQAETKDTVLLPLALADGFGGGYTEYFIWTFPIHFLISARRPVFVASLGVIMNLISSAYLWKADVWLPDEFLHLNMPALVSSAIAAVLFVMVVHFLFERHREKTLSAALHALLLNHAAAPQPIRCREDEQPERQAIAETAAAAEVAANQEDPGLAEIPSPPVIIDAVFTALENQVALLLIAGCSRRDISRKLALTSEEVNNYINAIRAKVNDAGEPEPDLINASIASEFGLTRRETDMLRCLRLNMTNAEIAGELFISEETVRIHVRNLLKKLGLENRRNVSAWVEGLKDNAG
ncbi:MAG: helix-turn-helix transcriptional regulator [Firmicutes bacterium]|nr:helix-turn-helix transcriptional regulator [Bacillota bacterium]